MYDFVLMFSFRICTSGSIETFLTKRFVRIRRTTREKKTRSNRRLRPALGSPIKSASRAAPLQFRSDVAIQRSDEVRATRECQQLPRKPRGTHENNRQLFSARPHGSCGSLYDLDGWVDVVCVASASAVCLRSGDGCWYSINAAARSGALRAAEHVWEIVCVHSPPPPPPPALPRRRLSHHTCVRHRDTRPNRQMHIGILAGRTQWRMDTVAHQFE